MGKLGKNYRIEMLLAQAREITDGGKVIVMDGETPLPKEVVEAWVS